MDLEVVNKVKPTPNEVNDKDIKFTNDQQKAINGLSEFISSPFNSNNFINGLSGAGGTGKTFIIKYLINKSRLSSSVIKCTSSTHKACRVFSQALGGKKVDTIQSTLGLRLNTKLEDFNPDNPQFDPAAKPKLDEIQLLIVDEASMLPAKLVTYIIKVCKEKAIKIIFIGDSFQLAPVNENKSIAFSRCAKLYVLEEVVRQAEENPIMILLNKLRYDIKNSKFTFFEYLSRNLNEMNYNDIGEGFSIVGKQSFKNLIDVCFKDEAYQYNIDMYRIIAYTNVRVNAWNNYIRNNIIDDSDKSILTKNDLLMSYETIVNEFNEIVINNSEEYIIHDMINFVDSDYGFKGFQVKFQLVHGGQITKPLFIIDHRDTLTLQKYVEYRNELVLRAKQANGATRSKRWKDYYDFTTSYLLATNLTVNGSFISRTIDYGFAITSHKSQGSTYDTVFVDVNDMLYDKLGRMYTDKEDMLRRLYVACSRAKTNLILCYGQ